MRGARTWFCDEARQLPLVVEALRGDVDLAQWATENRSWIEEQLRSYGGILFRHFAVDDQQAFERFTAAVSSQLLNYVEGATPRTDLGHHVYTSTEFPASRRIMPHNELSYVRNWPTRIWFCCLVPASHGGETPISDVRRVLERIPAAVREKFETKGWMLTRNFGNGLSLPWRQSFGVSTELELDSYCRDADVELEWLDPERLRTRQIRPAVIKHPATGERLWFNHAAFWNLYSLPEEVRSSLLAILPPEEVPYNTHYGEGSAIEEQDVLAINAAYDAELVAFRWQRGDVLMLDNMLIAHGRAPYQGPRKVIVSMGDPHADADRAPSPGAHANRF